MISRNRLVKKLSRLFGSDRLLTDPSQVEKHSWDALSEVRIHPFRRLKFKSPLCVVFPDSTAEVRQVVLLANAERLPIVPYGGGSGLMGGAISLQPGIVLDLRKMDSILEIDREGRMVLAQAGVVLESLEDSLNKNGLILGHDPWTLPVATVGGAISTNSLGYRGGKYGSMGDQLLGLEAVLPNGEVLRTRPVPKSSTGINLNHLLIGGEGCFGIVTEATLRVFPVPEERRVHAFRFSSFEQGFVAVQKIFGSGLRPALIDFGDDCAKPHRAVLYLGFEGRKETARVEEELSLTICGKEGGRKLPQAEAERFWRERHAIAHRFMQSRNRKRERRRDEIHRDWIHVALRASKVLAFRETAKGIIAKHRVTLQECGLWTQPELFSMRVAIKGGAQPESVLEDAIEELLQLVQQMGGSMEYCHGVGVKLAPLMAEEHGYGLEVMRQIKKVLDPNNIMNPGKMGL
jgi:alkyldihydroxyacetonephosphate synthase